MNKRDHNSSEARFSTRVIFIGLVLLILTTIIFFLASNYYIIKAEVEKTVLFQPKDSVVAKTNRKLEIVKDSDLSFSLDQLEKQGKSKVLVFEFQEDEEEQQIINLLSRVLKNKHIGYQSAFVNPSFPPVVQLWCQPGTEKEWEDRLRMEAKNVNMVIVRVAERNDYYDD